LGCVVLLKRKKACIVVHAPRADLGGVSPVCHLPPLPG
jgi:hypothetical protein